ncbi:RNA polymerase sigma-70 factor, ECF subfamily [Chitinophaga jiangningensis]|uniref:RNA polymerase sigma-70 factor, ECF subfamily n=1 Tax=Chitinophaga jiangningensis TaxID=1419482 RepID=A0A1M6YTH8_9BACT|nr:RNA polymerase sigma-70 factor [Chitinophaga jiangningensis]SHL21440.1 RNA polymerase sigma-70 factor, ECF subfamily [Chitinophaga jiangningensis]
MTRDNAYSDLELVSMLKRGDVQAFDLLYSRHWAGMYQSAFYLLRDQNACMDIVQDIFAWLWEKRTELDIQTVPAYLRSAVRFKVINYIRSGKIRADFYAELAGITLPAEPGPQDFLELNDLKIIIQQAIMDLPEKCREIFLLSRDGQLTNRQIADLLNLSIKTVEAQKTIALKRIRTAVDPHLLALLLLPVVTHCS